MTIFSKSEFYPVVVDPFGSFIKPSQNPKINAVRWWWWFCVKILSEFCGASKFSKMVVVGLIGTRKEMIIAHVPASDHYHAPFPCNGLALHSQCHFLSTSVRAKYICKFINFEINNLNNRIHEISQIDSLFMCLHLTVTTHHPLVMDLLLMHCADR